MSWIEDLTAKIEALTDEDFNRQQLRAARHGYSWPSPPCANVEVPLDFNPWMLRWAVACVNSEPIGPGPPGCVMLAGLSFENFRAKAVFEVRRGIPWNHGLVTAAAGQKPYPEVDFSKLLDSPQSTRPG